MYIWDDSNSVFRQVLMAVRRRQTPRVSGAERHSRPGQGRVQHIIRLDYNVLTDTSQSKNGVWGMTPGA